MRGKTVFMSLGIILILCATSYSSLDVHSGADLETSSGKTVLLSHEMEKLVPLDYSGIIGKSNRTSTSYGGTMNVMVTLGLRNEPQLLSFLSNLSNPENPQYHQYITAEEFTERYSPNVQEYQNFTSYFSSFPGVKLQTFPDRMSIVITADSSVISDIFNTSMVSVELRNNSYYGTVNIPELPAYLSKDVTGISGLSDRVAAQIAPLAIEGKYNPAGNGNIKSESPTGKLITNITGSELQTAYDETPLLNESYPTNAVIATILWAGENGTSKTTVAPFNPAEIYAYYNQTLPSSEPHSRVYGVPLNGAPAPGPSATNDTTGANVENSLDLEMIGSTAPGSSIYNVYGVSATNTTIDEALQFILSPSGQYKSALDNVSVISNSYGSPEYNSSAWYEDLQEAQARGITVLASSGDSGDNVLSQDYESNLVYPGDYVQFPSAMSYNDFGVTAVGGTTLTLYPNYTIQDQTVWYETEPLLSVLLGAFLGGSTGGISDIYPEPSWQRETEANSVINGSGRGVPDIAAIANNTIMTLTTGGSLTPAQYLVEGTSVSSPATAGMIGEIDSILAAKGESRLGFLNPSIYLLAQSFLSTGSSSGRPQAFYNVVSGHNAVYSAQKGYSLVTGWGSINAYNFSTYMDRNYSLTFIESGLPQNSSWSVSLGPSIQGNTTGKSISFNLTPGFYPYTIGTDVNYSAITVSGKTFLDYSNVNNTVIFLRFAELVFNVSPVSSFITVNDLHIHLKNGSGAFNITSGGYFINATMNQHLPYSNYMYLLLNSTYNINISLAGIHDYGYLTGSVLKNGTVVTANGMGIPVYENQFNVSLPVGSYYISSYIRGYSNLGSEITVKPNGTTFINVNTSRIFNPELVTGYLNTGNASVTFGPYTAFVNSTGYYQIWVNAGNYSISVFANGYMPVTASHVFHSSTEMNFTLLPLPTDAVNYSENSINSTYYNMTIQNLILGHGYAEVSFSAARNGTFIIYLNLANLSYATQGLLSSSTVLLNGKYVNNYSLAFTSSNTEILEVNNVSGSGVMFWKLVPYATLPSRNVSNPNSLTTELERDVLLVAMVLAAIFATIFSVTRRKRTKTRK